MPTLIFINLENFPSECTKTSESNNISYINPLNADLNPICHLLALLGAHHILLFSRVRLKSLKNGRSPSYQITSHRRHNDRLFKPNSAKSAQERTKKPRFFGGGCRGVFQAVRTKIYATTPKTTIIQRLCLYNVYQVNSNTGGHQRNRIT